jgi:hypothetical protein
VDLRNANGGDGENQCSICNANNGATLASGGEEERYTFTINNLRMYLSHFYNLFYPLPKVVSTISEGVIDYLLKEYHPL